MTLGGLGALANAFWRAPWLIRNGSQVVMEAVLALETSAREFGARNRPLLSSL